MSGAKCQVVNPRTPFGMHDFKFKIQDGRFKIAEFASFESQMAR
jgi:hypothetical protein